MTDFVPYFKGIGKRTIYLMPRMIGVTTPPIFGLTAEEVRERSAHQGPIDVARLRGQVD